MVPEREPQDTDILLEKLSSKQTLPTKHTLHGADSDVESDMDGIRQRYRSPPEALGLLPDKELADDSTSDLFPDRLCTFAELPEWMQDNEYILAFYRPPTFSYRRCFASLCYLHNETGNIYTHAIGALMYLILGGVTGHMLYQQDTTSWSDSIVFYLSIGGAVICLGLSASFHMLNCHSEKVCATWNRCDYVGIVTMIVGALYPAIYYGFFCKALARNIYMIMVTLLGAATIYICISKHFASPEYRWFRTITFLSLGGSGFLPIIHLLISFGVSNLHTQRIHFTNHFS
jgi:adiponectin receptor